MQLEKFIRRLFANQYVRYLLAMACLIGAIVMFVALIHEIHVLMEMGW
jgi:ABC-type Fe3+-siderophore transport system permease subunit